MQPHAAPVGGGEQRRLDVLEFRQPRFVIVVARFFFSSASDSVFGPATGSPVTTLFGPRSPTPYCTAVTWRGYQLE
jgi:hypothetical protein